MDWSSLQSGPTLWACLTPKFPSLFILKVATGLGTASWISSQDSTKTWSWKADFKGSGKPGVIHSVTYAPRQCFFTEENICSSADVNTERSCKEDHVLFSAEGWLKALKHTESWCEIHLGDIRNRQKRLDWKFFVGISRWSSFEQLAHADTTTKWKRWCSSWLPQNFAGLLWV